MGITLLLFGILVVFAQSSAVASFIYTLFQKRRPLGPLSIEH